MAYDIYGNNLRKGYCEVHPNVHEEYPCSLCYANENQRKQNYAEEEKKFQLQYEVSFQDQFNIPESFTATPHLRYAQRLINVSDCFVKKERWLQQMWQGSGGTQEWRWVEEIEE